MLLYFVRVIFTRWIFLTIVQVFKLMADASGNQAIDTANSLRLIRNITSFFDRPVVEMHHQCCRRNLSPESSLYFATYI